MLPSRSSTPRPRQMVMNQSSVTEFGRDPSTPGESRWTPLSDTPNKKCQRPWIECPPADARPRKRRRIASSDTVVTLADISMNPPSQHRHRQNPSHPHSSSSGQLLDWGLNSSLHGICQTCRKCKSNYLCSRCRTPTCSVCTRTCTITAMSTPPTPLLCYSATPSPKLTSSRLPDDSSDSFEGIDVDDLRARLAVSGNLSTTSKRRSSSSTSAAPSRQPDSSDTSWWEEPLSGGCGRVICQACAVEDSDSHESTCLDCLDGFAFSS